jgi:predicted transposase YdaD
MLETNMDQWKAKAVAEGVLIGEQRGLQMGKLEGILEGKLEGESLALQRLLTRRFGPIPPDTLEQIASANLEQIEAWFDAAINAPHLAAVFTPTPN